MLAMTRGGLYTGVIARECNDRGDPWTICRAYARVLFTGLLRCARNDKRGPILTLIYYQW